MTDQFIEAMLKANEYDTFEEYWNDYAKHIYARGQATHIWVANYQHNITALKDTLEPSVNETCLERQYANSITISFMGVSAKIDYDAVAYNALISALNIIEKEI